MASPAQTTTYFIVVTNACGTGVDQVTVNVLEANVTATGGGTICLGQSLPATAEGALTYQWIPGSVASPATGDSTQLTPPESMWIYVLGIDENNCFDKDSVYMNVLPLPSADAGPDQYYDYPGFVYLFGNAFGNEYYWSPPMGLSCTTCIYPQASPDIPRHYTLHVVDEFGCVGKDSVYVRPYFPLWVPNTITPNNDGLNDVFRAYGDFITGFHLIIFDRWGNLVFESTDINEVWTGGIDGYYVQNDVYPWVIEYDTSERREKISGHVTVVR
jgi:gliding motility-associated-like protein